MTNILNLPGVIVEDYKQTASTLILVVKSQIKQQVALRAVKPAIIYIKITDRQVRDLPMGDREVILRVNPRRFKCKNCRKP